jgi:hypothetical protein
MNSSWPWGSQLLSELLRNLEKSGNIWKYALVGFSWLIQNGSILSANRSISVLSPVEFHFTGRRSFFWPRWDADDAAFEAANACRSETRHENLARVLGNWLEYVRMNPDQDISRYFKHFRAQVTPCITCNFLVWSCLLDWFVWHAEPRTGELSEIGDLHEKDGPGNREDGDRFRGRSFRRQVEDPFWHMQMWTSSLSKMVWIFTVSIPYRTTHDFVIWVLHSKYGWTIHNKSL